MLLSSMSSTTMLLLPGYELAEKVFQSPSKVAFRAIRTADACPIMVKLPLSGNYYKENVDLLEQEYHLLSAYPLKGFPDLLQKTRLEEHFVLELNDFEGINFELFLSTHTISETNCLCIALNLIAIVEELHNNDLLHRDIRPVNFLIDPHTFSLKCIDLSTAVTLKAECVMPPLSEKFQHGLDYISPEQTGRIALTEDIRSDLYSLGVLLYRLFTGKIPFLSEDMNEIIHAHLARQPVAPRICNPCVPDMLSEIILKLLEKKPEARYQTAKGLKHDVSKCRQHLTTHQQVHFVLGEKDIPGLFLFQETFVGRNKEKEEILKVFEQAKEQAQLIFLHGSSGTGKSALAEEMCKSILSEQVFFVTGKCDQQLQNIPYGAVTQSFKELILLLLTEPEPRRKQWKKAIQDAVGSFGKLITDAIPELEGLIGKQPEVETIPLTDASIRNMLVFSNFMQVFALPGRLLVIFLDDLQWADSGTLHFVQSAAVRMKHLVIMGALRSDTPEGAALSTVLAESDRAGVPLHQIHLLPLSPVQIQEWISETFSCALSRAIPLAEYVFTQTLGNPLFIQGLLQSLIKDLVIAFDHQEKKWKWDLEKVKAHSDSPSLSGQISQKIAHLPSETQLVLSYAACMGETFDLEIVAALLDKTSHDTVEDLKEAMNSSLIRPLKHQSDLPSENHSSKIRYQFSHEQVRQAAYALLSADCKEEVHLTIGYTLLDKTPNANLEKEIFEIVSHLNRSNNLIKEEEERVKMASLNVLAAKKAKSATAFDVASEYYNTALHYLSKDELPSDSATKTWEAYQPFMLSLHMQAAEMAYVTRRFERAEMLSETILKHVFTLKDRINARLLQIQSFIYQKECEKALTLALDTLKTLGLYFPSAPGNSHILVAFLTCKWALRGKKTEDLERLPVMQNPEILEAFRIIQTITATAYLTKPTLYPLLVLKMVQLSVKYGNAPQSPLVYATYGAIVNAVQTNNAACYAFGKMALQLLKQSEYTAIKERTLLIFNLINRVSNEHIHHSLQPLKASYAKGVQSGDMEYAVYASNSYCVLLLLSGKNLPWVREEMLLCNTLPKAHHSDFSSCGNEALIQIITNLMGENSVPASLSGTYFKEEEGFQEIFKTNQKSKIFICYLYKSIICYLLEDYTQGVEHNNKSLTYLNDVKGMLLEPQLYFYRTLLFLALYAVDANKKWLKSASDSKNKLKKWAIQVPVNHMHRWHMAEAEYNRVIKRDKEAVEHYDKAILLSKENNHLHEEALAHELTGKYWLRKGQTREASVYLTSAWVLYQKWGCVLKLRQLQEHYSSFLVSENHVHAFRLTGSSPVRENVAGTFDLATLMKASTAISSEVVFSRLLEKLMKVVIENAGAQVGYFILERFGQLYIEARQSIEEEKVVLLKKPLKHSGLLAESIVTHVFTSKDTVLIQNAQESEQFGKELATLHSSVQSVLCLPTINQGKLIGVLYLENNLTTGAFTNDRVEILKLLASQIAVSIENAMLYENLEQKVEERTTHIQIQKEEIERQKQLVEEKSRYKEQFFANMSHEIRTPMTAIIGMSELLFGTTLTDKQLEYTRGIHYSSENLLAIINDILDYSKIEAGKFSFIKKPFQLKERMIRLTYILQCLADEKGIELRVNVNENISAQLIGDPLRLHQILLNLASNAIKFTDNGYVEITVSKCAETETHEELLFEVNDTGIGIAEDKLHYIFETFSQLEEERSSSQAGTGLGLFIAKRLVEEQNGKMEVSSKLKLGTQFRFNLMFEKSAIYQIRKKEAIEYPLKGLRILLVEDNLFNQVVAEDLLKMMIPEVQVTIAGNGAQAIDKFAEQVFDLVLMDIKMPVMDGYKATQAIRARNKVIPILALTANSNPLEAEKCKASGMNDYISKPIETQKLKEKIGRLVGFRELV